jgi:hypothetical protein
MFRHFSARKIDEFCKLLIKCTSAIVLTLVDAIFASSLTSAAVVQIVGPSGMSSYGTRIEIQGKIEEGDYEKFLEAALVTGPGLGIGGDAHGLMEIALDSPGGDAVEAIKIGRLVRSLQWSTSAPIKLSERGLCRVGQESGYRNDCNCASACYLIYAGGIYRSGSFLGVHRVFVEREYLAEMSLIEAAKISQNIENLTNSYLDEMGAPESVKSKIKKTSSKSISILTKDEIGGGPTEDIHEWIIANCGGIAPHGHDWIDPELKNEYEAGEREKTWKLIDCQRELLYGSSVQVYSGIMRIAISKANPNFIKSGSMLDHLYKNTDEDVLKFILSDMRSGYCVEDYWDKSQNSWQLRKMIQPFYNNLGDPPLHPRCGN